VKRIQKRKRVDVDSVILCTTKESLLDIKRDKINDFLSSGITISHATIDKAKVGENEVEDMRREICLFEKSS
jgi:hypothetical protein